MVTIFIAVLKELISDRLRDLILIESHQVHGWFFNSQLSIDQKSSLENLLRSIGAFTSLNNDEESLKAIEGMIYACREQVNDHRKRNKQKENTGKVSTGLTELYMHCADFNAKLQRLKKLAAAPSTNTPEFLGFSLLDIPYDKTPENIIYYCACLYLGTNVFKRPEWSDADIRQKKEEMLYAKLGWLNRLIRPDEPLQRKKDISLSILDLIISKNAEIVNKDKMELPFAVNLLTGVSISPANPTAASKGTLYEIFYPAKNIINLMNEKNSKTVELESNELEVELEERRAQPRQSDRDERHPRHDRYVKQSGEERGSARMRQDERAQPRQQSPKVPEEDERQEMQHLQEKQRLQERQRLEEIETQLREASLEERDADEELEYNVLGMHH